MKKRKYIAWVLMWVCVVMLTASVFPHHHHRELLCMQHDVEACDGRCDATHTHHHPDDDACDGSHTCHAGCVTRFSSVSPDRMEDSALPHYAFCQFLYAVARGWASLLPSAEGHPDAMPGYVETLHSTCLPSVWGLRAPPCLAA